MNATNSRKMSVKKHSMEPKHGVPGHYRPAQPPRGVYEYV